MTRREGQHSTELKALRKELREAESQNLALQKEILVLKDKLEKTRRERYGPFFTSRPVLTCHPVLPVMTLILLPSSSLQR